MFALAATLIQGDLTACLGAFLDCLEVFVEKGNCSAHKAILLSECDCSASCSKSLLRHCNSLMALFLTQISVAGCCEVETK